MVTFADVVVSLAATLTGDGLVKVCTLVELTVVDSEPVNR